MKKLPIFLAIGAIALVAYSMVYLNDQTFSIKASKKRTTKTKKVDDFDKIVVDGVFEVDVTYSSQEKIAIDAPNNIQKLIKLNVKSGTLIVTLDKNARVNSKDGFKIHISTAKLNHFELSGAASITLNNSLKDKNFTIESSGAAIFKGDIDVEVASLDLSGATHVDLSGTAQTADLDVSGASHLNDYSFSVNDLNVDLSGASSTTITSTNSLNAEVSGASSLKYKGNPSIKGLNTSGAASARKR